MKQKKNEPPEPFPEAPEHLSERARALWAVLGPKHARTVGRRVLFEQGLAALDAAEAARRIVAAEGMTSKTEKTGALHVHPATKLEREARTQFTKIWVSLGIHYHTAEY